MSDGGWSSRLLVLSPEPSELRMGRRDGPRTSRHAGSLLKTSPPVRRKSATTASGQWGRYSHGPLDVPQGDHPPLRCWLWAPRKANRCTRNSTTPMPPWGHCTLCPMVDLPQQSGRFRMIPSSDYDLESIACGVVHARREAASYPVPAADSPSARGLYAAASAASHQALHLTAVPLRSLAAGALGRSAAEREDL